ncbi:hypothetical protein D9M71_303890 [compost metagenome]
MPRGDSVIARSKRTGGRLWMIIKKSCSNTRPLNSTHQNRQKTLPSFRPIAAGCAGTPRESDCSSA